MILSYLEIVKNEVSLKFQRLVLSQVAVCDGNYNQIATIQTLSLVCSQFKLMNLRSTRTQHKFVSCYPLFPVYCFSINVNFVRLYNQKMVLLVKQVN